MRISRLTLPLPRHPLLRALVLAGLLAVGFVVGAVLLAVAAIAMLVRRWTRDRERRAADPDIIDGEFTVVPPRPRVSLPHGD